MRANLAALEVGPWVGGEAGGSGAGYRSYGDGKDSALEGGNGGQGNCHRKESGSGNISRRPDEGNGSWRSGKQATQRPQERNPARGGGYSPRRKDEDGEQWEGSSGD